VRDDDDDDNEGSFTESFPNTYYNWQEYVVSVMLIFVLNIKLTCE
jgi:hypothetical protein